MASQQERKVGPDLSPEFRWQSRRAACWRVTWATRPSCSPAPASTSPLARAVRTTAARSRRG